MKAKTQKRDYQPLLLDSPTVAVIEDMTDQERSDITKLLYALSVIGAVDSRDIVACAGYQLLFQHQLVHRCQFGRGRDHIVCNDRGTELLNKLIS